MEFRCSGYLNWHRNKGSLGVILLTTEMEGKRETLFEPDSRDLGNFIC